MQITIRTALHTLLAICLIPSLLFIFLLWQRTADAQLQLIHSEFLFEASKVGHEVESQIAAATLELEVLKNSQHAKQENWKNLYQDATRIVANHPNFAAIGLAGQTGDLIFVTKTPFDQPTFQTRDSETVQRAIITGKPNLSGPFTIPDAEGYRVAVSMPIRSHRSRNYVLRVIFDADYFSNLIMREAWPDQWTCTLFDRNGIIISRSDKNDKFVGQNIGIPAKSFANVSGYKAVTYQNSDGGTAHAFLYQIHHGDWFVAVEANEASFHEKYYAELKRFLPASLALIIVIAAFAFSGSTHIARHLQTLEVFFGKKEKLLSKNFFIIYEIESLKKSLTRLVKDFDNTSKELAVTNIEKQSIYDLYDHAPCGYHSLSPEGDILYINKTEADWLGYPKSELIGKRYEHFISDKSRNKFLHESSSFFKNGYAKDLEFELVRKDRSIIPVAISASLLRDDSGNAIMSRSIVFDIRERKVFEQQLLELSTKDVLTGLSNRRHFYELASQSINLCERENTTLALAIVDIDHFKSINDKYGHYVGDIALKAVSEKMKSFLRCGDIVARIGGEEFAIILPKLDIHSAQSVLNRLRESIGTLTVQTPDDEVIHISVSIGVTEKQRLEMDIDSMISRADIALYHSKSAGRNRVSTG